MRRIIRVGAVVFTVVAAVSVNIAQQAKPVTASSQSSAPAAKAVLTRPQPAGMPVEDQSALVKQYCMGCHNDNVKSGGIALSKLDLAHPDQNPELAERVIRQVKAGQMPKVGSPRPSADVLKKFSTTLSDETDRSAAAKVDPGSRPFQRLTRTEYAKSVKDLLGIEEDVSALLPPDTISEGFDNIADAQPFSATLMEGYLRAAAKISRDALGDTKAEPSSAVYKIPRTASQLAHVDGAPFGTRGGISVMYNFPADGEYDFRGLLHVVPTGQLFGGPLTAKTPEQLEFSIDGERVAIKEIDSRMSESLPTGTNLYSGRVFVAAGAHRVSAAFPVHHSDLIDDDIMPIDHTLSDTTIGTDNEITSYPHLREFEIKGPFNVTGVSDTASRRRVFTCRPLNANEELPCATKIVTNLMKVAYRRPTTAEDLEGVMTFYERSRKNADFETGIRSALEAILVSPNFVFRFEEVPAGVKPGQIYRISDVDLASRLSYFLWNTFPDDELLNVARQGRLKDPIVLERQVHRMLADPRSESLATKFAGEWLHLPDLMNLHPDAHYYANYDYTLAEAMQRETELFVDSIFREDRSVVDLLTSDQTFVNDRLAHHYGFPNVGGAEFKRVTVPVDYRRGLLGKGAILALTSVADRTSPVLRGKWVMGVLLGTPPPPPPPAVPKLDATSPVTEGKALTIRERMEAHRANVTCNNCHRLIDPIGLALENFDVTGAWRTLDTTPGISPEGLRVHTIGVPIDAKTQMSDGTPLDGPASLRQAMVARSDQFIQTLTEKLMAYAIGRRVAYFDMPSIRAIDREAAKNNTRFSAIVLGIVKSPAFQMAKAKPMPTESAAK
jgi:hypothetical protein